MIYQQGAVVLLSLAITIAGYDLYFKGRLNRYAPQLILMGGDWWDTLVLIRITNFCHFTKQTLNWWTDRTDNGIFEKSGS